MANEVRKYLDSAGVSVLWNLISEKFSTKEFAGEGTELKIDENTYNDLVSYINAKADKAVLDAVKQASGNSSETAASVAAALQEYKGTNDARVKAIEDDYLKASDKTKLENQINGIDLKAATLIGDDANKSVRTIANEELAKQLIAENADESLNTLQEIAQWIQDHPNDAAEMNTSIEALKAAGLDSMHYKGLFTDEIALQFEENLLIPKKGDVYRDATAGILKVYDGTKFVDSHTLTTIAIDANILSFGDNGLVVSGNTKNFELRAPTTKVMIDYIQSLTLTENEIKAACGITE